MKLKLILLVACGYFTIGSLLSQSTIIGQDTSVRVITTAVPFLTIAPDAARSGLGETGGAGESLKAPIYWNPASLSSATKSFGITYSYTPWLGKIINDMSLTYISAYYSFSDKHTIGSSLRYFDLGDIFFVHPGQTNSYNPREYALDIGYSYVLSRKLALGLAVRYFNSNISGNFTTSNIEARITDGLTFDLGLNYRNEFKMFGRESYLNLGSVISNIGANVSYRDEDIKDFLPTNLRIGSNLVLTASSNLDIELNLDFNKLLVPTPPVYEIDPDTGAVVVDAEGNPVIALGKDPYRKFFSRTFGSMWDAPNGIDEEFQEITINSGIGFTYKEKLSVRAGYFYEHKNKGNRKFWTVGAGYQIDPFEIDLSYLIPSEKNHLLSETLRLSISVSLS